MHSCTTQCGLHAGSLTLRLDCKQQRCADTTTAMCTLCDAIFQFDCASHFLAWGVHWSVMHLQQPRFSLVHLVYALFWEDGLRCIYNDVDLHRRTPDLGTKHAGRSRDAAVVPQEAVLTEAEQAVLTEAERRFMGSR